MAFIETVPAEQADGAVRTMYEQVQAKREYIPNYTLLFSHRPEVMAAWLQLISSISGNMDLRRYELVTLAAARALRSSYCSLAHGSVLLEKVFEPAQLTAILNDTDPGDLTDAERTMMRYAVKIVRDASSVNEGDIQTLRDHGFTDADIFDIAAAAAARCFFSKLLDALGAVPDAIYSEMDAEVRRQLTVGREIEGLGEREPREGPSEIARHG